MRTALVALVLAWAPASAAQDEPSVAVVLDEASVAIDEARFVDADVALDRAARSTLSRDELLRWLGLRALLSFADGRLGALEEALQGYASLLGPDEPLPSFPTPLRTRIAELREAGLHVALRATPATTPTTEGRSVALPAEASSDPGHLVRSIEVWLSIDGAPEALVLPTEARPIEGDVHRDVELRYRLLARGPGDAVIALEGTPEAPLVAVLPGLPRGVDEGLVAVLVIAGVVVVAGAVVLGWGASDDWWRGDTTVIRTPLLSF